MCEMRKTVIYGAGNYGLKLLAYFNEMGLKVDFFCQTDVESERKLNGIEIISFKQLLCIEGDISVFIAIKDNDEARLIELKLRATMGSRADIFIMSQMIENVFSPEEGYCLICGKRTTFTEGGNDYSIFSRRHIIGGGKRSKCLCPKCSSTDRARWSFWNIVNNTQILNKKCSVLHFGPQDGEQIIREKIMFNRYCDYYGADVEMGRGDHVVDMTNMQFADESMDYIIANHILEHIVDEGKALDELYRVIRKDGKVLLSFPICSDYDITDEAPGIAMSDEERIERFAQKDHVRLYGRDYIDRIQAHGFSAKIYSPQDYFSALMIEKYGLIADDVCVVCTKM